MKVQEELIGEYKRRHEQARPEMLDANRRTGWHNYTLFLCDHGFHLD